MKKQKTVFSAHELVHIFVNQKQKEGKTALKHACGGGFSGERSGTEMYGYRSSYRQLYFEGKQIWSYGSHYLLGELHCNDKVLLVNSEKSSNTTQGHKHALERAANHLTVIEVPYPETPKNKENLQKLIEDIYSTFDNFIRTRSYASWEIKGIYSAVKNFNDFCSVFKIKDSAVISEDFEDLLNEMFQYKEHHQKKNEEKRELRAAEKRGIRKAEFEADKIKYLVRIKEWKQLKTNSIPTRKFNTFYNSDEFIFLRVKEDRLETSWHIEVPLREAIYFYQKIKNNEKVIGMELDGFEITEVNKEFIRVGCHKLFFKEIDRTLEKYT